MKYLLFLVPLCCLFYQCKVEELPPLEPFEFFPDGVDIIRLDTVYNYPKGQSTQYILFYFNTDFSELTSEELALMSRIAVFRDGEYIKGIPKNSVSFFGEKEYKVGDKHTFSFGLTGINGTIQAKAGTEITFTVD